MRTCRKFFYWLAALLSFATTPRIALSAQIDEPEGYARLDQLVTVFSNILAIVVIIGGFLAFLALIAGGFRYITARGDPKSIDAARGMITWAIIGLIMLIGSWLIIRFVANFTGLDLTSFRIGF